MATFLSILDDRAQLRFWRKKIESSLGRNGHLEAQDEEFLESNYDLVSKLAHQFFFRKEECRDLGQLLVKLVSSIYVHGHSKPNVDHMWTMVKYGHADLIDILFDDSFAIEKIVHWIAAGLNDRVNLSQFNEDREKLEKIFEMALLHGNKEIVDRMIQDHGMILDTRCVDDVADGGNLELFIMLGPLSDAQMRSALYQAAENDSDQIVAYILDRLDPCHFKVEELVNWCLTNSCVRTLKLLLERFPDFNIVAYSQTTRGRESYPTLQYLLIHAKRKIVEMYLANMAKFY